jgi:predicted aspartyl protease
MSNGCPVAEVKVQSQTASFTFDTGVTHACISDALVKALGLPTKRAVTDEGIPIEFNRQPVSSVVIPSFHIGGLELADVPFVVLPAKQIASLMGDKIDGIIGAPFLPAFAAKLDFPAKKLTLWYPGALTAKEVADAGLTDAHRIPLVQRLDQSGSPFVSVRLSDTVAEIMKVDTGSAVTMVSSATAKDLKLRAETKQKNYPTFHGSFTLNIGKLNRIRLGDVSSDNVDVTWADSFHHGAEPTLGLNYFGDGLMLIDVAGGALYLKPGEASGARK